MYTVPTPSAEVQAYWTATSTNSKTGNIPQQWIGRSSEETLSTCAGCPLLRLPGAPPLTGPECYAHRGTVKLAAASVRRKAARKPRLYTLREALARRMFSARAVRFAAIGCVCSDKPRLRTELAEVHAAGLSALAYCHHTARNADLAGLVTASANTLTEARAAFETGFLKVALVVPKGTAQTEIDRLALELGVKVLLCPADASILRTGGRSYYRRTCNECRICDGATGPQTLILFPEKGPAPQLRQIR